MAASVSIRIAAFLEGLGVEQAFLKKFTLAQTPTAAVYQYRVQATADSDEVLDVGDVAIVDLVVIKCVANDMDIDTTYVDAFNAEITVNEGEVAAFTPSGTVRIKNNGAGETVTYEYIVVGRT